MIPRTCKVLPYTLWFIKSQYRLSLHTTVWSLHYTQPLIYKSAKHEIKLSNHILLVHNTLVMRTIHFIGSLHAASCEMRRVYVKEMMFLIFKAGIQSKTEQKASLSFKAERQTYVYIVAVNTRWRLWDENCTHGRNGMISADNLGPTLSFMRCIHS